MINNTTGIRPDGSVNVHNRISYLQGVIAHCPHFYGCAETKEALKQIFLLEGFKICEGITKKGEPCKNWAEKMTHAVITTTKKCRTLVLWCN